MGSFFLDAYAPLLVPLFIGVGMSFIQADVVIRKFSLYGFILYFLGWLIFYLQAKPSEKKRRYFLPAFMLALVSDLMKLIFDIQRKHFLAGIFFTTAAWSFLLWTMLDGEWDEESNHYIIFGIISILASYLYLLPLQRRDGKLFDLSLVIYTFGWTLISIYFLK